MVFFSLSVWGEKRGEVLHTHKIIYGSPVKLCFNANSPEQKQLIKTLDVKAYTTIWGSIIYTLKTSLTQAVISPTNLLQQPRIYCKWAEFRRGSTRHHIRARTVNTAGALINSSRRSRWKLQRRGATNSLQARCSLSLRGVTALACFFLSFFFSFFPLQRLCCRCRLSLPPPLSVSVRHS